MLQRESCDKKRGHKPKGSNVPGAKSLFKMSATRMDYEDDILDRTDFMKTTKRNQLRKKVARMSFERLIVI